jgi:hypothetical protein
MTTKVWAASFLDPALNFIKTNANKICLCSEEPTTYLGATDTVYLAGATLTSGDFTGPSDGLVSGRRLMIAQKTGITVAATGNARYLALVSTISSTLLYVGLCVPVDLTISSTISIDPAIIEIKDPF